MTGSAQALPFELSADETPLTSPKTSQEFDLGPDLKQPNQLQRWLSILKYAWQHHRIQILIVILAAAFIAMGVRSWIELQFPTYFKNSTAIPHVSPSNWTDWLIRIQAYFGIPTLLIALFVWIEGIREDWEDDLSKRISVFFFHGDDPVIICRYAWLAGADELRTWGQQVAKQAAGNEILDFRPDVEAKKPSLVVEPNGTICMHYAVCFKLTKPNEFLKRHQGECQYQNLAAKFKDVQAIPLIQARSLPIVADWEMTSE